MLEKNILRNSLSEIKTDILSRFAHYQINNGRVSADSLWDIPLNWCPATRYSSETGFQNRSVDFIPIGLLQNEISNVLSSANVLTNFDLNEHISADSDRL